MTERTIAQLNTDFADNTTGDITPADMRNLIESLVPAFGSMYISSAAATSISAQNTFTKVAGTTTLEAVARDMSMPANNRLRYDGAITRQFLIKAAFSMTAAASNEVYAFRLAKNGTTIAASEIQRFVGTGSDVGAAAVQASVELSTNDYVELFVENQTSSANPTIEVLHMFALGIVK